MEAPQTQKSNKMATFSVAVVLAIVSTAAGLCWGGVNYYSTSPSIRRGDRQNQQLKRQLTEVTAIGRNPRIPLGLCQGDCDNDAQCAPGLKCFQRSGNESIPGCTFPADNFFTSLDVCILSDDGENTNGGSDNIAKDENSTLTKEEDREDNGDTEVLITEEPAKAAPTPRPSSKPTTAPTSKPTSAPTLETTTGTDGKGEVPEDNGPMEVLMTDEPLKAAPTSMPTVDYYATDYEDSGPMEVLMTDEPATVAAPTSKPPTSAPTTNDRPTASPTAEGTKSWAQTYGMSEPFAFMGPPVTLPPKPEDLDWLFEKEYTDPRPLAKVGNDGLPVEVFPLGPCEGDCDSDKECAGPLVCFDRSGGEAVPGCTGKDKTSDDYCVWPEGYVDGVPTAEERDWSDGFALKLYWEEGYLWQNETIERKCESQEVHSCSVFCSLFFYVFQVLGQCS